jgi:hypothetical protein
MLLEATGQSVLDMPYWISLRMCHGNHNSLATEPSNFFDIYVHANRLPGQQANDPILDSSACSKQRLKPQKSSIFKLECQHDSPNNVLATSLNLPDLAGSSRLGQDVLPNGQVRDLASVRPSTL